MNILSAISLFIIQSIILARTKTLSIWTPITLICLDQNS